MDFYGCRRTDGTDRRTGRTDGRDERTGLKDGAGERDGRTGRDGRTVDIFHFFSICYFYGFRAE